MDFDLSKTIQPPSAATPLRVPLLRSNSAPFRTGPKIEGRQTTVDLCKPETKSLSDALISAVESGKWPLYLHGVAGSGKSYAAAWMFMLWSRDGGCGCRFWDASDKARECAGMRADGREGQIRQVVEDAGLIVLDDVGTRVLTVPQQDALLAILNWRGGKPLVVTGNLSLDKLREVTDDRIVSRLGRGTIIEFPERDRRLEQGAIIKL